MAIPFDPESLEISGDPVVAIEEVNHAIYAWNGGLRTGAAQVAVSDTGTLIYATGDVYPEDLLTANVVDQQGTSRDLGIAPAELIQPRVSPDGRRVAYSAGRPGQQQLWIYDIERSVSRRLASDSHDRYPVWSPDGTRIAYPSDRGGSFANLYVRAADGSGDPVRLTVGDRSQAAADWSSQGVLTFLSEGDIWVLPMDGADGTLPTRFMQTEAIELFPVFSPDGLFLAYMSNESGRSEVYVRPFPGPDPVTPISAGTGVAPAWSADGRRLFYDGREGTDLGTMMVVDVVPGGGFVVGRPRQLFEGPFESTALVRGFDVTPDGDFVTMSLSSLSPEPVTRLQVVLNWFEELRRLAPTDP